MTLRVPWFIVGFLLGFIGSIDGALLAVSIFLENSHSHPGWLLGIYGSVLVLVIALYFWALSQ